MSKNVINLPNRDGLVTQFIQVKDNIYKLEQEDFYPYRVIGTIDDIKAIDPSGGPFISPGYEIDGYVVKEITRQGGIVFIIEKKD